MTVTVEDLNARLEQLEARVDEHSLFPGASADVLFLLVASLNVFFMQAPRAPPPPHALPASALRLEPRACARTSARPAAAPRSAALECSRRAR